MQTANYHHIRDFLRDNRYDDAEFDVLPKLHAHPDYPSLYAITDTLRHLEIEHVALKANPDAFADLPSRFLAVIKSFTGSDIVYAQKKRGHVRVRYSNDYATTLSETEFRQAWMGIVIAVEENETRKRGKFPVGSYVATIAAFLVSVAVFFGRNEEMPLLAIGYFIMAWVGFGLGITAIQAQSGLTNIAVARFCQNGSRLSCHEVLSSRASKVFGSIPLSQIATFYFSFQIMAMLLAKFDQIVLPLAILAGVSVPVVLWSIYYQYSVVRKWCSICLSIGGVSLMQSSLFLGRGDFNVPTVQTFSSLAIFAVFIWIGIRLHAGRLSEKSRADSYASRYRKLSRNFDIFKVLHEQEKYVGEFPDEWPALYFGNPESPVRFDLIISASCPHCHTAFRKIGELAARNPESVAIRLLLNINPENRDNPHNAVYRVAFSQLILGSDKTALDSLVDWHGGNHDLQAWLSRWEHLPMLEQADALLWNYYDWCRERNLVSTPQVILGGRRIPSQYDIEDLGYFLHPIAKTQTQHAPFL